MQLESISPLAANRCHGIKDPQRLSCCCPVSKPGALSKKYISTLRLEHEQDLGLSGLQQVHFERKRCGVANLKTLCLNLYTRLPSYYLIGMQQKTWPQNLRFKRQTGLIHH